MNAEMFEKAQAAFAAAVKQAIGGDRKHGWGANDSFEVIDSLVAEFSAEIAEARGLPEEVGACLKEVINPSQFRQKLESKALNLLDKSESRNAKIEGLFSKF